MKLCSSAWKNRSMKKKLQYCVTSAKQVVYKRVHGAGQSTLLFSWFWCLKTALIMIKVRIMFYVLFRYYMLLFQDALILNKASVDRGSHMHWYWGRTFLLSTKFSWKRYFIFQPSSQSAVFVNKPNLFFRSQVLAVVWCTGSKPAC